MAPSSPVTVRVDNPATASPQATLSDIRRWLLENKVTAVSVTPIVDSSGTAFLVVFDSEETAEFFRAEFMGQRLD
jgi:hypothetical protein